DAKLVRLVGVVGIVTGRTGDAVILLRGKLRNLGALGMHGDEALAGMARTARVVARDASLAGVRRDRVRGVAPLVEALHELRCGVMALGALLGAQVRSVDALVNGGQVWRMLRAGTVAALALQGRAIAKLAGEQVEVVVSVFSSVGNQCRYLADVESQCRGDVVESLVHGLRILVEPD